MSKTGWRGFILLTALVAVGIAPSQSAHAYEFKTLYNFCAQPNCSDGSEPVAGLVMDKAGNLYGTTSRGGAVGDSMYEAGTVFELVFNKITGRFKEKILYSFCLEAGCPNGSFPSADLIIDGAGSLYGTAYFDGVHGKGTVFELVRNARGKYKVKLLYDFCCAEGGNSQAALVMDATGNLYGTTSEGGVNRGGTAFELVRNAHGKYRAKAKVLHSFCVSPCSDGAYPVSRLMMDGSGNLYGTTSDGGVNGGGTVFRLARDEITGKFREKVIYDSCAKPICADGSFADSGLIMDKSGNLYGTTENGGAHERGTVFELVLNKATGKFREKVLYDFCAKFACRDGASPAAGVIIDSAGNLYGTTSAGGEELKGGGTIFQLVFNKDTGTFEEIVLHSFPHGTDVVSSLIVDDAGNLYGTTYRKGGHQAGTVFELVKN